MSCTAGHSGTIVGPWVRLQPPVCTSMSRVCHVYVTCMSRISLGQHSMFSNVVHEHSTKDTVLCGLLLTWHRCNNTMPGCPQGQAIHYSMTNVVTLSSLQLYSVPGWCTLLDSILYWIPRIYCRIQCLNRCSYSFNTVLTCLDIHTDAMGYSTNAEPS